MTNTQKIKRMARAGAHFDAFAQIDYDQIHLIVLRARLKPPLEDIPKRMLKELRCVRDKLARKIRNHKKK